MEMCSAPWYAATSAPRRARAAGAIESGPLTSSCAAGPTEREPRKSLTTVALPSIAATTAGRWNGSFASGSACLICGMIAMASSRRTGPRSSGLSTLLARRRLRWAATFSCPSSVRIAQAQAVGPCTSTPFASAIPPSRSFSSVTRSRLSTQSRIPQIGAAGSGQHGLRGVPHEAHRELQVLDRDALVRRVDQAGRQLGVHHPQREEAVGDGAEGLAEPVAVCEPGDADRRGPRFRVDLADPAGYGVPQRRLDRRACSPVRLEALQLVVAVSKHGAHDRLLLRPCRFRE